MSNENTGNDNKFIIDSLDGRKISYVTSEEKEILWHFTSKKFTIVENIHNSKSLECPKIINFERPDLVIEFNEFIICIEHFQIDASLNNKKGSLFKKKYNSKNLWENSTSLDKITKEIDCNISYKNLFSNTLKHFENHYKKINNYISNISDYFGDKKPIKKWFFLEYDVVFHSFFVHQNTKRIITPDFDMKFIDFLLERENVEGLLISYNSESDLRFISNNRRNLGKYVEEVDVFDTEKIKIIDYSKPYFMEFQKKI